MRENGKMATQKNGKAAELSLDVVALENLQNGDAAKEAAAAEADEEAAKTPADEVAEPVPYFQLFQYATRGEWALVVTGLVIALLTSAGQPIICILYGEFTTLLVDRHMENITSNPTSMLALFGGGRVLVNGSEEERREALLEDARAFGIGALAMAAVQFGLCVSCVMCLNYAAHKQVGRVRRMFLRAVLSQEMAWFDTRDVGTFASRLTEDLDKLQDGIGEKLGMFVFLVASFVASTAMALAHGWKLTLVVLSCAPAIAIPTAIMAKVQSGLAEREVAAYAKAGAAAEEALAAHRTVVAFAGHDKEAERYAERLVPAERAGCKRGLFSSLGGGITWFVIYGSYSLAFWYGVELILEGRGTGDAEYTPAILVIVLFGVLTGAMNMGLTAPHLEAFAVARGAAAAVFAVLRRRPPLDALADARRLAALPPEPPPLGDVHFKDVHFRYPARPAAPVLQGLDLTVRRGETVALVGASGCGKSTVVQLVQRLYDPQRGRVTLDGRDLRSLNVAWLRAHIGVVGQEPALFGVSVAENIRYGREDATREDIEAAAKDACAHDFIMRLPQGYETLVGERGAQLSGGQKQRIAIARALVRNPRILLLDEATSALDLHSEAAVQRALQRAAKGRTTIVVAHRLSTIASADRIVVLAAGRVAEEGTHSELLARRGHYYSLVNTAAQGEGGVAVEAAGVVEQGPGAPEPLEQDGRADRLPAAMARQLSAPALSEDSDALPQPPQRLPDEEEDESKMDAPFTRILAMNAPEWPHVLVGCVSATLVGAALPFFAVLFGEVYRALSLEDPEEVRSETQVFSGLFLVVGLMTGLGTFLQMYMFAVAGTRLTQRLRRLAFAALLRQEPAFYDDERHRVGVMCARLSGDAASVQGATGSRIGSILQSTSTLALGVLLALFYSWKLTLVSLLGVPLVFAGVYLESRLMRGQGLHEKEALEGASKVAVEVMSNVRTVASLGGEEHFLRRYCDALAASEAAGRRKMRWRGVVFALGQCSWYLAYALSLYYGGWLVAYEGLPYENVIKVSEALIFGAWMLGQSLAFLPNFSTARLAAARLFALLDRRPRIKPPPPGVDPDKNDKFELSGNVEYRDVEFSYPTRPGARVLRGLRLQVEAGATVALVGPSGGGKSTCLQLLQRLYDPDEGAILADGQETHGLPAARLRAQLGLVAQEPVLFDRTVAENIAYGDNARPVPMEEVIAAARAANIHDFIVSLPEGYETRLGSKGTQLSGGQKQRIAIARALVRNPRILLLDEATSALDSQSEKVVQAALERARTGRTCVVIAHRLATVRQADLICVVRDGAVEEAGTHAQLMALRGRYYRMHQQGATGE